VNVPVPVPVPEEGAIKSFDHEKLDAYQVAIEFRECLLRIVSMLTRFVRRSPG
jgi:hypothetical protein